MEDTDNQVKYETDVKLLSRLIEHDMQQRKTWSDKQVALHDMRRNGVQRAGIQPWQANLPYMHSDAAIENMKPVYVGHVWNGELLADFTTRDEAINTDAVILRSQWFDYELRNNSNFEKEILSEVDIMCEAGFAYLRPFYNEYGQIEFEALRPLDVVVPYGTKDLQKATRVAIKKLLTPTEYALDDRFEVRDDASIKKMMGCVDQELSDLEDQKTDELGFEKHTKHIEIWEVYVRDSDGWILHTINKNLKDKPLRSAFRLPYTFNGFGFLPLVCFPFEIIDVGGIYDSRGLPEKLAADEAELTLNRNMEIDAVRVAGIPLFTNNGQVANPKNMTFGSLRILPAGIEPKNFPFPNVNFQILENQILSRSERRITSPDYSIQKMSGSSDRRTAKEIASIESLTMQSTNLRIKTFRIALSETYKYSDAILCFHRSSDECVVINGKRVVIPRDVMGATYNIVPAGSDSVWNKENQINRAIQIKQVMGPAPWFDHEGWDKQILTFFDPRYAQKYFIPSNLKSDSERVNQLTENLVLERGNMVPIKQTDDHAIHAVTIFGEMVKAMVIGVNAPPQTQQAFMQHLQEHMAALKQANPEQFKQVEAQLEQMKQQAAVLMQQKMAATQPQASQQEPSLSDSIPQ